MQSRFISLCHYISNNDIYIQQSSANECTNEFTNRCTDYISGEFDIFELLHNTQLNNAVHFSYSLQKRNLTCVLTLHYALGRFINLYQNVSLLKLPLLVIGK